MIDLKTFRKSNNLTQTELGDYLGIKKSFISLIESGKAKLPQEKFDKLTSNPYGWDTTMLTSPSSTSITATADRNSTARVNVNHNSDNTDILVKEIELLHEQIRTLQEEKKWMQSIIDRLTK